mmetsp:Transcript_7147/g.17459  ORF Transcript_7147/g.17459 Transcript_7147/m.17459 type:complete len:1557 (+) Transcript_7147:99-4769(+)
MRLGSAQPRIASAKRGSGGRFPRQSFSKYDFFNHNLILAFLLLWIAVPTIAEEKPSSCRVLENHENTHKNHCQWEALDSPSQIDALTGWLRSLDGGIVEQEKFEIVTRIPSDDSVNPEFDFVATQDIPEGTVLMEIPHTAMIGNDIQEEELDYLESCKEIDDGLKRQLATCMAIHSIANERKKGLESRYHPYLEFIFGSGNPRGKKPSSWSNRGQRFFWNMIGQFNTVYKPAEEVHNFDHKTFCEDYMEIMNQSRSPSNEKGSSIEDQAYDYFAKHTWGTTLIPLFDMIPHRNGKWKNVEARFVETETNKHISVKPRRRRFDIWRREDSKDSSEMKLVVYAHRAIQRGEPLRVSINQCEHLGCESLKLEYTTSEILADTGMIEDYPRRWSIMTDPEDNYATVFDIDLVINEDGDESQKKTFRMIKYNHPSDEIFKHALLATSIDRWRLMNEVIMDRTKEWEIEVAQDRHEYNVLFDYHRSYAEAFELAWLHRNDEVSSSHVNDPLRIENTVQNTMEGYDDLSELKGVALHTKGWYTPCAEGAIIGGGRRVGKINTFYQEIEYLYDEDYDNTYMKMATWLHSGSNFRAHYHEAVIHVALQYVENPKRVAYIGGGDNMVLAEFLKYDSIEKVVGMELDQQVCRLSMKYFGTTPAFHDERVEWWFGNGALSLQLLPEDYWGSFDLVLVDLLTDVADGIKVTAGLSLSEVALLLMKPDGGVLARNDDFADRSEVLQRLAKRVVFYDYQDTPRLCELSTTLASDSIDFARGPRYNHGIETLARLTQFDEDGYYGWSRYFDSTNTTAAENSNVEFKDEDVCNKIQISLQEEQAITSSGGVHLVIEAENVTASLESDNLPMLHKAIESIAKQNGLSPLTTVHLPDQDIHAFMLLCEKGYIKMQTYPQFQYVAFDLALWGDNSFVENSVVIQTHLVASVGGGSIAGSVSTFRVVTGGMNDSEDPKERRNSLVENALHYYCGESTGADHAKSGENKLSAKIDEDKEELFVDQSILLSMIFTGITNWSDQSPFFVIFCGKEDGEICEGYSSVATDYEDMFYPIYSCQSFDDMKGCESDITEKLLAVVSERKLFDGFVLDRSVPLEMGRILHKVFNNTIVQPQVFEASFSALAPGGEGTWRNILLDRFRTEIIIAPPVQKADFEISNGTRSENWGVVSTRNYHFVDDLQKSLEVIQETTGWVTTTRKILDSIVPLVTDWNPPKVPTDEDFFRGEVMNQWFGERPLANQFILQMELEFHPAPVEVGEIVLVGKEFMRDGVMLHGFIIDYYEATIVEIEGANSIVAQTTPYVLIDGTSVSYQHKYQNPHSKTIPRNQIRKISPREKHRHFNVGDLVLVKERHHVTKEVIPVAWYAAVIISMNGSGVSLRAKDVGHEDESHLYNIPFDDIMVYSESPEFSIPEAGISLETLESAFADSVSKAGLAIESSHMQPLMIGNGYLVSFLSPKGNGIMKWDGAGRVEVNMLVIEGRYARRGFSFEHDIRRFKKSFLDTLPRLKVVAQDSFPRGYGKVVSFQHEKVPNPRAGGDYIPHWMKSHVRQSEPTTSTLTE